MSQTLVEQRWSRHEVKKKRELPQIPVLTMNSICCAKQYKKSICFDFFVKGCSTPFEQQYHYFLEGIRFCLKAFSWWSNTRHQISCLQLWKRAERLQWNQQNTHLKNMLSKERGTISVASSDPRGGGLTTICARLHLGSYPMVKIWLKFCSTDTDMC